MTEAENYALLHDGGNTEQAYKLANNMSISIDQDRKNEVTVFHFADGSHIYASGPEFRVATQAEADADWNLEARPASWSDKEG